MANFLSGLGDDAVALAVTGGAGGATLVGLDQAYKRVEFVQKWPRLTALGTAIVGGALGVAAGRWVHTGVGMGIGTVAVAYGAVQLAGSFETTQALRLGPGLAPPLMGAGDRARAMRSIAGGARGRLAGGATDMERRQPIPGVDGMANVDMRRVTPTPGVPVTGMDPRVAGTLY